MNGRPAGIESLKITRPTVVLMTRCTLSRTIARQVVNTENDVLRRHGNRLTTGRAQDVVARKHQHRGFDLRFRTERNVDRHLVAVEVGVERRADERVNLDRLAFDEHRFESLDAKTVQRRSAIQKHRVLANHLFENVPNDRLLPFNHLARLFDRGGVTLLLELVVDEWLEQLERHLLRQTALVQFQFRTDDDHRTSRVVDTLTEQVLTKTSLLTFERSAQRLQRTIVNATQHATATTVIKQRIDRFLKHRLFVAHDYFGRAQLH